MWKELFYTINQLLLKCKFNKINVNEWIFTNEIAFLYTWKPMIYSLLFKFVGVCSVKLRLFLWITRVNHLICINKVLKANF